MAGRDFDLQAHSTYSDGTLPPAAVVARAARDGIRLLALTDHDTVDGVPEAQRAGRELGVRVTPAAEITAVDGTHEDLHILGYEIDIEDEGLASALVDFRADRQRRTLAMVGRLRELGFEVDETGLDARASAGLPIGRPHIANAVLSHPANAARLQAEGILGHDEFFPAYIVSGAPAFVGRTHPTVGQAIDLIHASGGVAVWAHPFWDVPSPEEVLATLARFAGMGLDGVEAFYATHSEEQTHLLCDAAASRGLLTTGSTDFHSPDHELFSAMGAFELFGREPQLGVIGGS